MTIVTCALAINDMNAPIDSSCTQHIRDAAGAKGGGKLRLKPKDVQLSAVVAGGGTGRPAVDRQGIGADDSEDRQRVSPPAPPVQGIHVVPLDERRQHWANIDAASAPLWP